MPDLLVLFLAACGTALATGLGAIPVWFLGSRAARADAVPARLRGRGDGGRLGRRPAAARRPKKAPPSAVCSAGLLLGAALLGVARRRLDPTSGFMGRSGPGARTSALVFVVLFVHSLPEGLAVGTAFASDRAGLSLFVILAIAIQNIPEGTSVAIPMAAAGYGRARQFWAAVGTSAPQPVGAVDRLPGGRRGQRPAAVLLRLRRRRDAGLIAVELLPQAYEDRRRWRAPTLGIVLGAAVMLVLDLLLGV